MKSKLITLTATALAVGFSAWLAGCAAKQTPIKSTPPLQSLDVLMPKFQVRSNAPNEYSVATMAYNETNWVVAVTVPTAYDAYAVIADTKARLIIKYEVAKAISEALAR